MTKKFMPLLLAAALAAVPPAARAAVEGSPHDLASQGYIVTSKEKLPEKCLFCHLPMPGGDLFPAPDVPPSLAYYARSGLICYSCHDGTTIVSDQVDATQGAFHPDAHPLTLGRMPPPRFETGQAELPIRESRLECITCHTPHDSANRPFLRRPVAELCTACHAGLENKGYGANNLGGGHPIHETVEDDVGGASPIDLQPPFKTAFPSSYPIIGGKDLPFIHWNRGGHLAGGQVGTIECFTCHTVHGTEKTAPAATLLTIDPVRDTADRFCEGCHRGRRGDGKKSTAYPNPGGTATEGTYHACDDSRVTPLLERTVAIRAATSWPLGTASSKPIICTTCHRAHGGMSGSPALRKPVQASSFCEECHLPDVGPFHHPITGTLGSDRRCLKPASNFQVGEWGGMYCSSCHVAHNAGSGGKESNFVPLLKSDITRDDLCLACHPSDFYTCLEPDKGKADHFLGDPTLVSTYEDTTPPLRETEWPETRLLSRYGGAPLATVTDSTGRNVICLSCHVFRKGLESKLAQPLPHYLLSLSGNEVEWATDVGAYLCTGCHGENPGTGGSGHTHPLMTGLCEKLPQIPDAPPPPIPPATCTATGKVNCDSCHRTHGAVANGGYYILETDGGQNKDARTIHPRIDFAGLCRLCHIEK